jgi:subtilisin family serine protease
LPTTRHIASLFAILAIFGLIWTASTSSQASRANENSDRGSLAARGWTGPLARRSGTVGAVIELADPPTAQVFVAQRERGTLAPLATLTAQTQLARIEAAQQGMLARLATINARVLYRTQRLYNGIAVHVDASRLQEIASLPGVRAIHPLVPKTIENSGSVPLIGAPTFWEQTIGQDKGTGKGITIAIIDTGIDYAHHDFGGNGDYIGITDTSAPVFNAKVVGGKDFVGDAYDAGSSDPANSTPHPDANPIDCLSDPTTSGHGTHVAGTAAGYGVNADGTTYAGPWTSATPFSTMKIAPGVAPEAKLMALRAFGCHGSTDVADQALEYAVDPNGDGNFSDHVDVINMSLGSSYGSNYDSTSVASKNAVNLGVIVVASAGNNGDTNYVTGSPASEDSVISVASSTQSDTVYDGIKINAPAGLAGNQSAAFSVLYSWATAPDVTGDVYYPATNRDGCATFTGSDATNMSGKVALLDWTDNSCGSITRTGNVVKAGGIGAILVDNSDIFDLSINGSSVIPTVSMSKATGDLLKANLSGLNVTFTNSLRSSILTSDPQLNDMLSTFSSRGPSRSGALKPDVAAPGGNIFSALAGSGSSGQTLSGTSMAAPHVAGAMALLKQLHPDWTPQQLKALVMNTAIKDVRSALVANSQIYGPARVGAGRVNLPNAAAQSVIVFDTAHPERVSISFGNVGVTGNAQITRSVSLVNKGGSSATFDLAYVPVTMAPGVSFTLSRPSITLAAGETQTVDVTLSVNLAAMKFVHDPTLSDTVAGSPRSFITDASGYLTLTPPAAQAAALRVPIYAAPRPASAMKASMVSGAIKLTGTGLNGAAPPADTRSLVSAFELQSTSPKAATLSESLRYSDLQYVGISSSYPKQKAVGTTTIFFGITTYGKWVSPNEPYFEVDIDTNKDGIPDYYLYNSNTGTSDPNDVFLTKLVKASDNTTLDEYPLNFLDSSQADTQPFNTNVIVLAVDAVDLGLTDNASSFNYQVFTDSNVDSPSLQDNTSVLTYDVKKPGIAFGGTPNAGPMYADLPGSLPFSLDRGAYLANRSHGILLVHHHNLDGARVDALGQYFSLLPLVER